MEYFHNPVQWYKLQAELINYVSSTSHFQICWKNASEFYKDTPTMSN